MIASYLKYYRINTQLEFMPKSSNKNVSGLCVEMECTVKEFQTNIVYTVRYEDKDYIVDGTSFREI